MIGFMYRQYYSLTGNGGRNERYAVVNTCDKVNPVGRFKK